MSIATEIMPKIKVAVVGNSVLVRNFIKSSVNSQKDMEAVCTTPDTYAAWQSIRKFHPDVVVLSAEVLHRDILDFLQRHMYLQHIPVLMICTQTMHNSTDRMVRYGTVAVDSVFIPHADIKGGLQTGIDEITTKIRVLSEAHLRALPSIKPVSSKSHIFSALINPTKSTQMVFAMGASTGGTEALKEILIQMPQDCPGIVVAQHLPGGFTRSFVERLDSVCRITVKEAKHGDRILPGHAYIAPGHSHLLLSRSGNSYVCELSTGVPVNFHRPSVDVLFESTARVAGGNAVGIILTGMGKDGAMGLRKMRDAGAHTFAQDEASCVVFGMPKEAIALGGVDEIVPLKDMARHILDYLHSFDSNGLRK